MTTTKWSQLGRAMRSGVAGVNLWAALVALGLAPTAAALAASLTAVLTGSLEATLAVALVVALAANIVLGLLLVISRRYARALELDMELIGDQMRKWRAPQEPWLPKGQGETPIDNAMLEEFYSRATEIARSVAPDTELGLGWISLSDPLVSFNGFTQVGRKRLRIWCTPKDRVEIVQLERADRSPYPTSRPEELPWRRDPSWRDLVTLSWATEQPFSGDVTLWPIYHKGTVPQPSGAWRIVYARVDAGTRGTETEYVLSNGRLMRTRPVDLLQSRA